MGRLLVRLSLFAGVAGLAGCAVFSGKPPLPKHSSIEHAGKPAAATDYAALVQGADVIYFPQERAASGARAEPAAQLLEAAQRSGQPVAVAWELIEVGQQTALDEIQTRSDGARAELIDRLSLAGTGRAREHCRSVLREEPGVRQLALRLPAPLLEKIATDESLTSEEMKLIPVGYASPPGGLQVFAERFAGRSGNERGLAAAYRAQLLRQEFAAEIIVRYFRGAGREAKLVVFMPASDFIAGQGVPFFVAQKIKLRQLVLGPGRAARTGGPLLTRQWRRGLQIVDRAPIALRD